MVQLYLNERNSGNFHQLKVDLAKGEIVEKQHLAGRHSHVDTNDMQKCEAACLNDPRVQKAIREMELPKDATIVVEPWTYATDGMYDMKDKMTMVCCLLCNIRIEWLTYCTVLLLYATLGPP
jgi:primary-amine oxidase